MKKYKQLRFELEESNENEFTETSYAYSDDEDDKGAKTTGRPKREIEGSSKF